MKLLRLEIENINAIYGPQVVDFVEGLREAPLFLICGPTGAGKSTILDAISLALFGYTPRLRNQGSREERLDAQPELALSRGTAYGRAELTFRKSSPEGGAQTFRATWEVWRGNKLHPNPAGTLQGPYRKLEGQAADGTWTALGNEFPNGRQDYQATLHRVLEGFTLQDFTRCMLLAQGDFAAFLKASDAERSAILERLTRTGVYQEIGARAAQRCAQARQATLQARTALGGVQLLEPGAEAELRADLETHTAEARVARDLAASAQARLAWLEQAGALVRQQREAEDGLAAAEAGFREAAAELAGLAAHEAAGPALEALRRARTERTRAQARTDALARAQATLAELQARLGNQEGPLQTARVALEAARQDLLDRQPELQEARLLRGLAVTAQGEDARAQAALVQAQAAEQQARERLARAQVELAGRRQALDTAQAELAQAPFAQLAAARGALEARIQACLDRDRELEADRLRGAQLQAEIAAAAAACAGLEAAAGAAQAASVPLQAELDACLRDCAAQLAGAPDPPESRRRAEAARNALEQQRGRLQELGGRLAQAETTRAAARDTQGEAEAGATRAAAARAEAGQAEAALAAARSEAEQTARSLDLMRWARDLAQERGRLSPAAPCPLCGATDHPALGDPEQEARDRQLQAECRQLDTRMAEAQAVLDRALARHAQLLRGADQAEIQGLEAARRSRAAEAALAACDQAVQAAAMAAGLAGQDDQLALAQTELADRLSRLEAAQARLARAEADLARAREACNQGQRAADGQQAAFQIARAGLEQQRAWAAQGRARWAEAAAALDGERQALRTELAAHARPEPLPEALAEALRALRDRVDRYDRALARQTQALAGHDQAVQAEQAVRSGLDPAAQARVDRATEATARRDALRKAQAAAAAVLGGQDPDPVEAGLRAALAAAEQAWQRLDQAIQALRTERQRAQVQGESALAERDAAVRARDQAEQALAPLLVPWGGEAALAGQELPPERVAALQTRRAALDTARTRAEARLAAVRDQVREHREQRPLGLDGLGGIGRSDGADQADPIDRAGRTDHPDAVDRPGGADQPDAADRPGGTDRPDTVDRLDGANRTRGIDRPDLQVRIQAELAAALEAQRHHDEAAGSARSRLEAQAQALQRHAAAMADLQAAQREEALWVRMNGLIGSNGGEAFRKFAQVLNLRDLLARANLRLARLRPRYRLIPARDRDQVERLAFAIEDRDHADAVGSVNNLSGGEAFLVSLALALALADYRTVRMPIETLLLDEGFGTLDRATLGEVMGLLGSLTHANTQVGIISHVESLQESALPRIRVEPVGLGRSRIVLEDPLGRG